MYYTNSNSTIGTGIHMNFPTTVTNNTSAITNNKLGIPITYSSSYYQANLVASLFYNKKLIPGKLYVSDTSFDTSYCSFIDSTYKTTIKLTTTGNHLVDAPIFYIKEALDEHYNKYYIFSDNKSNYLAFKKITNNGYSYLVCLKQLK